MKKQSYLMTFIHFFFIIFLSFSSFLYAQDPASSKPSAGLQYQFARWPGFKKAAFSITFDDYYRFQVTYATPLLDQHNFKATYYIITNRVGQGWAPDWDTVNLLASHGHEIGSHSKNHANFLVLSQHPEFADSMRREFTDSRDTINSRVPSQQCETFAWPFGAVSPSAVLSSENYYMACRGSSNYFEGPVPVDFYNIYSQHIYTCTPLDSVNGYIDKILNIKGWLVERWHGFRVGNDTNGYEPVPIEEFEDHLEYVAQMESDLWIAPLAQVVKYIRERETSILALIDSTGNTVKLSLTNYLPDTMFHYRVPLTLKVQLYGKMADVYKIEQGNNDIPFNIYTEYGIPYLFFDAIPNDSLIVLYLPDPAGTDDQFALNQEALAYPNPFNSSATITFNLAVSEFACIRVYDRFGHLIRDFSRIYPAGRNSFEFNGSEITGGIYQCIIGHAKDHFNSASS
jgi:peptidoglycan-N-acetylglucosamine deacetylase